MSLRKHQRELAGIAKRIAGGEDITDIIVSVTPGGGKSLLPVILAHELLPAYADCICWVVPRSNLQLQGEKAFKSPVAAGLYGLKHEIRISTGDVNPSRGMAGFITTYQAIGSNWSVIAQDFLRYRYSLFLDEPHHVTAESSWAKALQPLIDRAQLRIYGAP